MVELLNWPPSKGENPYEPARVEITEREVGRTERIIERAPELQEVEIEAINDLESGAHEIENPSEEDAAAMLEEARLENTPPEPLRGKFHCMYHVATVASLTIEQACDLLFTLDKEREEVSSWREFAMPEFMDVQIDYPLSMAVLLRVRPYTRKVFWKDGEASEREIFSCGYFMHVIAREYQRIYAEHKKYGVWGHALDDLYFEGFIIEEGGKATMLIGS